MVGSTLARCLLAPDMIRLTTTLPRAWNFERNISSTRSCEKPRRSQDPRALKIPDVVLDSSNDLSTISGKLVEKIRPKKGSAPAPSLLKTPEDAMSSLHQIVTGWGEDSKYRLLARMCKFCLFDAFETRRTCPTDVVWKRYSTKTPSSRYRDESQQGASTSIFH